MVYCSFFGGMQINAVVSGGEVITIITACSTPDVAPTAVCNSHAARRGCFSGCLGAGRIKVEEERIFVPPVRAFCSVPFSSPLIFACRGGRRLRPTSIFIATAGRPLLE
ncbi:hypothetical protein B0H13DRAFT_2656900 [Mycena leptocephala]|nr:hypothetical protein B0H13DRAFT_2656900 [Mycena leptocephala]